MSTLNSLGEIPYNNKMFNFYMDQELVDTELILANGKIKTHSIILATQSEKLYNMLMSQAGEEKTVMLKEYSKETMRIILEYMYRGIVTYPSHSDDDVKALIHFLGLPIKIDPKDECKVEKTEEEIEDSVIEVKKDEVFVEISDNEIETNFNDSSNKPNSKLQDVINDPKIKIENSSSGPSDESFDFLTECSNNPEIEVAQTSSENEKSLLSMNSNTKQRKMKNVVKNPFSDYVTVKKSEETIPTTSQSMLKIHHKDRCISKFQPENSSTDISPNKRQKPVSKDVPSGNSQCLTKEYLNNQRLSKSENHEKDKTNSWINKKREQNEKSEETPTSTVQSLPKKQRKDVSKNPDTNIWFNKKHNPNYFPKNYCLMCEKNKINIKCHIKIFHKKLARFPNHICQKCSKSFFFEEFYNCHKEMCE